MFFLPQGLMAPGGPRPGLQQQEGWVGSASGPGQQGAMQARMALNSAPMRPSSQPGPRQMLQAPMMNSGENTGLEFPNPFMLFSF